MLELDMVARAYNPSTWRLMQEDVCESETSLGYRAFSQRKREREIQVTTLGMGNLGARALPSSWCTTQKMCFSFLHQV